MKNDELGIYQKIRESVNNWLEENPKFKFAQYLMIAPDLLHLMCRLVLDKDVSSANKAKLGFAIAYFVSPVDLMPEVIIGPTGYLDDIAIAAYALKSIINDTNKEIVEKYWAGEGDVLEQIQGILAVADEMVGTNVWKKLKGMLDKKESTEKKEGPAA